MVRASHQSSEECGFDPRLGSETVFLRLEFDERLSIIKYHFCRLANYILLRESSSSGEGVKSIEKALFCTFVGIVEKLS